MRFWETIGACPCVDGFGQGTHLLLATTGGWTYACVARPERWQSMEGQPTDDPLVIKNSDEPTCEVCKMLLADNLKTCLVKSNWPITWERVL